MLTAVLLVFLQFVSLSGLADGLFDDVLFVQSIISVLLMFIVASSVVNLFFPGWVLHHLVKVKMVNSSSDTVSRQVFFLLDELARKKTINTPALAVYESKDINAFATGFDHGNAIIVVSRGLLHGLHHDEQQAVLAHELTHIENHDMLTLSLMQNVLNVLVMLPCHIVGWAIDKHLLRRANLHGPAYYITWFSLQVVWGVMATMLVMWFSRWREFRADKGAAELVGVPKMQSALACLRAVQEHDDLPDELGAFGISGHIGKGIKRLFVSHPPLTERIVALRDDGH
jgi:heat shock protein HtpX